MAFACVRSSRAAAYDKLTFMKEGQEPILFTLNKQSEMKALELGLDNAGLTGSEFAADLSEAAFEADYDDPDFDGKHNPPRLTRLYDPELDVTPENAEYVRAAASATVALDSMKAVLLGRKRTAKKILKRLS